MKVNLLFLFRILDKLPVVLQSGAHFSCSAYDFFSVIFCSVSLSAVTQFPRQDQWFHPDSYLVAAFVLSKLRV